MRANPTCRWWTASAAVSLAIVMIACAGAPTDEQANGNGGPALDAAGRGDGDEHGGGEHGQEGGEHDGEHGEEGGEHDGEHGEGGHGEGEEGEESGVYVGRAETWDETRRGARLVLRFDESRGAFVGTVENTTERTLCAVRVEVHLGDGPELGPTSSADLPPDESLDVELPAEGASFATWTAHPEVSACG